MRISPRSQGNEKRSVLADVVSYLKPASTSEMRYVRMLCDLCCLTYKVIVALGMRLRGAEPACRAARPQPASHGPREAGRCTVRSSTSSRRPR